MAAPHSCYVPGRAGLRLALAGLAIAASARATLGQAYTIEPVDLDPAIESSRAAGVTGDGHVFGAMVLEGGRRTQGFIWRDGLIAQRVVPQDGNFAVFPRSLDIHHHVEVTAMTSGGDYAGVGSNVNFGHSSQPFFAWIPTSDPFPAQFLAADEVGNALMFGIAPTSPFITAVGTGTFLVGTSTYVRKGFISRLSRASDVGDPARMTVINGLGGNTSPSAALAVNAAGEVVGYVCTSTGARRAFVRSVAGILTDLGTLGGPTAVANAISDTGHVVGQADLASGQPRAFLRRAGTSVTIDLGTLGGGSSEALAVNNLGHVVGSSWTAEGGVRAFLWRDGEMLDLRGFLPRATPWSMTAASGINDAGVIVGTGLYQGRSLAFVMRPIVCRPDLNGDGNLDPDDLADFIACYFAEAAAPGACAAADYNGIAPADPDDLADYIAAYFGGCS